MGMTGILLFILSALVAWLCSIVCITFVTTYLSGARGTFVFTENRDWCYRNRRCIRSVVTVPNMTILTSAGHKQAFNSGSGDKSKNILWALCTGFRYLKCAGITSQSQAASQVELGLHICALNRGPWNGRCWSCDVQWIDASEVQVTH